MSRMGGWVRPRALELREHGIVRGCERGGHRPVRWVDGRMGVEIPMCVFTFRVVLVCNAGAVGCG